MVRTSLSPPAEGCGQTSLPQASWITGVRLIPFILSVLSVGQTCAGQSCAPVAHINHTHQSHTQAQVPLFDKDHAEVLASSFRSHHIMRNPVSSPDPQSVLIATTCSRSRNPLSHHTPLVPALCEGSSLMQTLRQIHGETKLFGPVKIPINRRMTSFLLRILSLTAVSNGTVCQLVMNQSSMCHLSPVGGFRVRSISV